MVLVPPHHPRAKPTANLPVSTPSTAYTNTKPTEKSTPNLPHTNPKPTFEINHASGEIVPLKLLRHPQKRFRSTPNLPCTNPQPTQYQQPKGRGPLDAYASGCFGQEEVPGFADPLQAGLRKTTGSKTESTALLLGRKCASALGPFRFQDGRFCLKFEVGVELVFGACGFQYFLRGWSKFKFKSCV